MGPDSSKNCHTSLALNFPRFLIFVLRYKFSDHNYCLCVNLGFSADRSTRTSKVDLNLLLKRDLRCHHTGVQPYKYTTTSFLSRDHKLPRRGILVLLPLFSFWLESSKPPLHWTSDSYFLGVFKRSGMVIDVNIRSLLNLKME